MNEIRVIGIKEFNGEEIKVLEGGFGENKRILTELQISQVHNMEIREVRKSIKRLIDNDRLKEDIDFIDIKRSGKEFTTFESILISLGYTKSGLTQATSIYILSERGYSKLVKSMDDDSSWEIMDELIDEYFTMREIINSDEQLKAKLTLAIFQGGIDALGAAKELSELVSKEAVIVAVKPLNEKIELDKPMVAFAEQVGTSKDTIDIGEFANVLYGKNIKIGRNRLFTWLKQNNYLNNDNTPRQKYIDNNYFESIEVTKDTTWGVNIYTKTMITGIGQLHIGNILINKGFEIIKEKNKNAIIIDM